MAIVLLLAVIAAIIAILVISYRRFKVSIYIHACIVYLVCMRKGSVVATYISVRIKYGYVIILYNLCTCIPSPH